MNDAILKVYELFSVLVPFFAACLLYTKSHKGASHGAGRFLLLGVFGLYIFAVFYFTGISTVYDILRTGPKLRQDQINLVPFSNGIDLTGYLLNVVMLVPFGLLLPSLWPQFGKGIYTVGAAFSFSLLIEVSQLFNHRRTDVDDLIMNTAGGVLGYLLFRVLTRLFFRAVPQTRKAGGEPFVLLGAMFLGRFLLFNEYGLAKVLYGF